MSEAKVPGKKKGAAERLEIWTRRSVHQHYKKFYHRHNTGYRLVTRIVLIAAALALVAGPLLIVRPQYRHFKERRAVRLAEAFLKKGDPRNAALRAQQALLLNPANVTACTVMARLAAEAHSPEELTWWLRVAELQPTLENKLLAAETGIHLQRPPFPVTTKLIAELAGIGATNARYQNIAAEVALERRQMDAAGADYAAAVHLDPTNAHYALNLALFRLASTNEAARTEARARLRQLRSDAECSPEALRGLAADRIKQTDYAAAREYSEELVSGREARLADQLQNLELLQQLKSSDFPLRLAAIQQQSVTNAPTAAVLAEWMLSHNLAADSLHWLMKQPHWLQSQRPIVLALVDAYEATGRWQELSQYASQGHWADLEYLRFAVVAHASTELGLTAVALSNWESAENEAAGHLERLRRLLELAARWRLQPEQEALFTRIVADFPQDQAAVKSLAHIYASNGNTRALNQLFARLGPLFPTNTEYQSILTGTSLLLRTNLPTAIKSAAAAYALAPKNPQAVAGYAYALHLNHQDAAGLAIFQKLSPDELSQPTPTLYYGVLLAAAGRPSEASPWLQSARSKTNFMLPEERQLLAQGLKEIPR